MSTEKQIKINKNHKKFKLNILSITYYTFNNENKNQYLSYENELLKIEYNNSQ